MMAVSPSISTTFPSGRLHIEIHVTLAIIAMDLNVVSVREAPPLLVSTNLGKCVSPVHREHFPITDRIVFFVLPTPTLAKVPVSVYLVPKGNIPILVHLIVMSTPNARRFNRPLTIP